MWIWSEYISDNSDCDPAVLYNYAHICGQGYGPTLLTTNIRIIIKYSRLTITIIAKILSPYPHFTISGKVEYF